MHKNVITTLVIAFVISSSTIFVAVPFGKAISDSTSVSGLINSDTVWTKTDSPYILTGIVGVASGITLTIEPGVTVNLGEYSLQVSGALYAQGSSGSNNITFISKTATYGNIAFTNGSSSWNEQKREGSIIENAILSSTSISINIASPKINNNTIGGSINVDYDAKPMISNNIITGDIGVHSSSPAINRNSIVGGINIGGDSPLISNNIIEGGGVAGVGIKFDSLYNVTIMNNTVYRCAVGVSGRGVGTIARNLIIDNDRGMELSSSRIAVENNTVAKNSVGIKLRTYALTIVNNNIEDNSQNSIYLEDVRADVVATHNWWGTIDTQLINLTIHDRKNEPKLGSVTFVPYVSFHLPDTPTTAYTPIERSTPPSEGSTTPTETDGQASNQTGLIQIAIAAIVLSVIINVALTLVVASLVRKKR